ncbi:hypothetical protein CUMW_228760 [Citrus unshiu]|nr:hypothetical protein CUMW_228760 [Citrus unshiu]
MVTKSSPFAADRPVHGCRGRSTADSVRRSSLPPPLTQRGLKYLSRPFRPPSLDFRSLLTDECILIILTLKRDIQAYM